MTLPLVQKKRSYKKEYRCEILKFYQIPFRSYGQFHSVFADKQSDKQRGHKLYAHHLLIWGHKNDILPFKCEQRASQFLTFL